MAAFNGSGTYVRSYDWTTDAANGVKISSTRFDEEMDGIATGLSTTICRDGQSTATARIPFALGIGVGDGTVGLPGINFSGDPDCGMYRIGTNNIGIGVFGAKVLDIGTGGLGVTGTLSSSGAATLASLAVTGAATVGTTLGVTGAATLSSTLNVTGASTLAAISGTTLSLTGAITATAGQHTLGGASGTTTAIPDTAAAVKLYSSSSVNWAGFGADGSGNAWIRTGLSGTPNARMVWQNDGVVTMPGNFSVGGTAAVTGAATLSSTLNVTGAATLSSTLSVSGASTLAGLSATTGSFSSTLGVTGAATLSSTLNVSGASTLAALSATTGSFSSTLSVSGASTLAALSATTGSFSSTLSVSGASTLAAPVSLGSTTGADAGATHLKINAGASAIASFGFGMTAGAMNHNVPTGSVHSFNVNGTRVATISATTVAIPGGTLAAPGMTFVGDTTLGIYGTAGQINFASAGSQLAFINSTGMGMTVAFAGIDGTVSLPGIRFYNDQDCGAYRIGVNNWALAAGGTKIVDMSTSAVAISTPLWVNQTAAFYGCQTETTATASGAWPHGVQGVDRGTLYLLTGASGGIVANFYQGSTANGVGGISCNTTTTTYATTSDKRKKEDPREFTRSGEIVDALEIWDFRWKASGERAIGVFAQDAMDVFPAAIAYDAEHDAWGADYSKFVPVAMQELKYLRRRVADLETRIP